MGMVSLGGGVGGGQCTGNKSSSGVQVDLTVGCTSQHIDIL